MNKNKAHVLVDIHTELNIKGSFTGDRPASISFRGISICTDVDLDWITPQAAKDSLDLKLDNIITALNEEVVNLESLPMSIEIRRKINTSNGKIFNLRQLKEEMKQQV